MKPVQIIAMVSGTFWGAAGLFWLWPLGGQQSGADVSVQGAELRDVPESAFDRVRFASPLFLDGTPASVQVEMVQPREPQPRSLQLPELTGLGSDEAGPMAWLSLAQEPARSLRLGERIGDWEVVSIDATSIELEAGERREQLFVFQSAQP